ncbi:bifunctional folylpolyglutamate synthase/dihydrofolate synthase [Tropicimonas isoalkanivorans]|uniref:Dihydrofolate synthase/folylpolyglutamate synthase n=1 Tax=Tropicimonas isoalkanivorans TaxID=441112 RepID=A0A1I1NWC8_9RHOB|nr:folylpolyglutamate synthase/dihydrofolate synthase family protein [Tropicimonas isoalkanivorans]SFD01909.1 dihydrofolate synthase / folylpolyglutamate synthase [Tropicimonas isoalkanivorans]
MTTTGSDVLLDRLTQLHSSEIDLSLDRTWRLLGALGNPQTSLPPVVHIAGTNGKGSTLAMIRAGLEHAGLSIHACTSPHLVRFHERILLAGREVSESALCDILERTLEANGGQPVTFFEATTCAAFLAFAETPADMLLLEVGMGGRMDTTNVIDRPRLTVITPVALDHQAFLGDSLAEIAAEKAGILKRGVPCVVGRQEEAALDVIEAQAARLGAPLVAQGQHWHAWEEHGRLVFQDDSGLLDLPLPALAGPHQIDNAGAALAVLRLLGRGEDACEAAMTHARWPARMQRLRRGPLVAAAPGAEIWLDGGHNAHATYAVAATLATLPHRPTHLVFALLANRDPVDVLAPLAPHAARLTAVPIPGEAGAADPRTLAAAAASSGIAAGTAPDVGTALESIVAECPNARIVICGSLYLAGHVLATNT